MAQTIPISGDVHPPFEVAAPNGVSYFDILRPVRRVAATFEEMSLTELKIANTIRHTNNLQVKSEMAALLKELREVRRHMETELSTIAVETAGQGTRIIQRNIDRTRVRPQRTDRLRSSIVCTPIATTIPTAAVGIAELGALNRGTRVVGMAGGYWASQEFGFTLSPRIVPGYFMPGYSRPSQTEFRQHPFFKQFSYSRGMPAMNIVNPIDIPPRNFLRGSIDDIWLYRHQRVERLKKITTASLNSVAAGTRAANALGQAMRRFGAP